MGSPAGVAPTHLSGAGYSQSYTVTLTLSVGTAQRDTLLWPVSFYIRMLFSTTLYRMTVSTTETTLLMAMLTAQFRALM